MKINPFIVGSGRAGQAIAKSLQILNLLEPDLDISTHKQVPRNSKLQDLTKNVENPVLFIAGPAALHAPLIVQASQAQFAMVFCEKPACVDLLQARQLQAIKTKVGVLHVYRQMWGPQTLREMVMASEFGQIISVESRYWQPSVAHRRVTTGPAQDGWKADIKLNGPHDVLLDLGTHWADLVSFIVGENPSAASAWLSYVNAEAPHQDTHVHLTLQFENDVRALGSISKVVHGATNELEITIIGEKKSASWTFMNPDEISIGHGRDRRLLRKKDSSIGALQPPFHGLGWLEGYVEIFRQGFSELQGKPFKAYPKLQESLQLTELLLSAVRS